MSSPSRAAREQSTLGESAFAFDQDDLQNTVTSKDASRSSFFTGAKNTAKIATKRLFSKSTADLQKDLSAAVSSPLPSSPAQQNPNESQEEFATPAGKHQQTPPQSVHKNYTSRAPLWDNTQTNQTAGLGLSTINCAEAAGTSAATTKTKDFYGWDSAGNSFECLADANAHRERKRTKQKKLRKKQEAREELQRTEMATTT